MAQNKVVYRYKLTEGFQEVEVPASASLLGVSMGCSSPRATYLCDVDDGEKRVDRFVAMRTGEPVRLPDGINLLHVKSQEGSHAWHFFLATDVDQAGGADVQALEGQAALEAAGKKGGKKTLALKDDPYTV